MNSKWLRSALVAAACAACISTPAQVATFTGNQRSPQPAQIQAILEWIETRHLGRDYDARGMHDKLLELDVAGKREWAAIAFPASQTAGRLRAGDRVELQAERLKPGLLIVHRFGAAKKGESTAQPIKGTRSAYTRGELRFAFAGNALEPTMTPAALNPSTLVTYPDEGIAEIELHYGDISRVDARVRLKALGKAGRYDDYRDFSIYLNVRGSSMFLSSTQLRDCALVLARLDASAAAGTLRCKRADEGDALLPTEFAFSAQRPPGL